MLKGTFVKNWHFFVVLGALILGLGFSDYALRHKKNRKVASAPENQHPRLVIEPISADEMIDNN